MRTGIVALAATVTLLVGGAPAYAGHVHGIQTANSPSTGQPIEGGGSWIANKNNGYYLGRATVGASFDNEYTDGGNWHYGRAITTVNMCGWVMPGSMGASRGDVADSCSTTTRERISHRLTFGRDFNARAHEAVTGTSAPANPGCPFFYNYFYGTDFGSNGGHWADQAPGTTASSVLYRFTTVDGGAVVVRDPNLGWGFLPFGCVTRPHDLFNDND